MAAFAQALTQGLGRTGNEYGQARQGLLGERLQLLQAAMALQELQSRIAESQQYGKYLEAEGKRYNAPQSQGTVTSGERILGLTFNPTTGRYETQDIGPATQKVTTQAKGEPIPGEQIGREKGTYWYPQTDPNGQVTGYLQTGAPKYPHLTAFDAWEKDPTKYLKFLQETERIKAASSKSSTFAPIYAIRALLQTAYEQNPELLPIISKLAPQVFERAGLQVPPDMAEVLGEVPQGQPISPVTGRPIGSRMPSAPTPATRTQSQFAAKGLTELPRVRKEAESLQNYLGPIQGRINVAFLLGRVGSTGDPQADQDLSQFRSDIEFLVSNAARFHLNSVRAVEKFEADANAGKDSYPALKGFFDSFENWATTSYKQQLGYGEQGKDNTTAPGNIVTLEEFLKEK